MPIANLTLTNTFDEWRTVTNQLVTFVNDLDSGNLTKFYSNSAPLTISENVTRGGKNFISLNVSSNVFDTSVLNVATANAVNIVFTSLGDTNATLNAAFTKTNTTTTIAVSSYNQANTARDNANVAIASISSALTIGNNAFNQANIARTQANTAFLAANTYAADVGTAANNYATTVGIGANNYAIAVGAAGNSYAREVGTSINTFTSFITANAGIGANNYAIAVGAAGNSYAREVGTTGNNYTREVGTAGNTFTALSYNQANTAYTRANLAYEFAQTVAGGDVANTIVSNKGAYDTANLAFAKANAALPNVSTTFNGNLRFPTGNVTIGLPTEQGIRLHVTHSSNVSNVLPEARFISGLQFTQINSNTSNGAWNDLTLPRDHTIIYSNGGIDDSANLVIGPWTDSSFGYKQDGTGRHGFNTSNPRFTIDANGSVNVSGSLIVSNTNVLDQITTVGINVGAGANVYAREVGTGSNNYTNAVGTAGNNYANTIVAGANNYLVTIIVPIGSNANNYAVSVGAAGNSYAREVGTGANNYTLLIVAPIGPNANAYATAVGTAGNAYAREVGTGANNYTLLIVAPIGPNANNYAVAVGAAGNSYARAVGAGANSYMLTIVDPIGSNANNYAVAVGAAGNSYMLSTITAASAGTNAYAREVGTAGNNFMTTTGTSIGAGANVYAREVGTVGNSYTTLVFNRANTINIKADLAFIHANQAFDKANAALVNLPGLVLAGDLILPQGNLSIGVDSSLGIRLHVNSWIGTANVLPQVEVMGGSQFIQFGANTSGGAWNDLVLDRDNTIIYGDFPSDVRANLVIAPWSDFSFGYKQDHQGRHGFNTSNPRFTIDANGSVNVSGSLIVSGTNIVDTIVAIAAAGNNYTREVGTAGNNYTREVGTAANNYMITTGAAIGAGSNAFSSIATNLTSGTVPAARLSGSYTGVTGVGTLTAGTWNAGTIGLAYGGTGATTAASARTNLGLGTAAVENIGTSGSVVAKLDGANFWTGIQSFGDGTTGVVVAINGANTTARNLVWRTNGVNRWNIVAATGPEVGGNSGSGLNISRYDDAGAFIDNPITISRSSGITTIKELALTTALGTTQGGTGATDAATARTNLGAAGTSVTNTFSIDQVIAVTGANDAFWYIRSDAGRNRGLILQTGTSNRWIVYTDGSAEAGANAGSNFVFNSYDDAGNFREQPLVISRATGITTLKQLALTNDLAITEGGTGSSTAAGARTNLGLGTAAVENVGTSGSVVAKLDGVNIWTGNQTFGNGTIAAGIGINGANNTSRNIQFRTAGITRWQMASTGAVEVGANTGSNFNVVRFDDAGNQMDAPLSIARNTGVTTLSQLALTTDLAVADGGTGASDAATARTNLGLGTIATQAASSVSITGGSITGITDLAVADGGTGASTAAAARTNLGIANNATRSIMISTSTPTGGVDGDVWYRI